MRTPRMKYVAAPVALMAALTLAGCGSSGKDDTKAKDEPSASAKAEKHIITVEYDEPKDDVEAYAESAFQEGGTDGVAEGFSKNFEFPVDLTIHVTSGEESPNYNPETHTVTLYYGFAEFTRQLLAQGDPTLTKGELETQWVSVNAFILIHELGHAFVDVFDIDVFSSEESAVDAMATTFFTDAVENGPEYAFYAANFFHLLQTVQGTPDDAQFQDEHALSVQRSYDIACAIAGSSDETMAQIRALGILKEERLARCPAEYQQKSEAWTNTLKKHLRPESERE